MEPQSSRYGSEIWRVAAASVAAAALFLVPFCFPLNFLAGYPCMLARFRMGARSAWAVTAFSGVAVVLVSGAIFGAGLGFLFGLLYTLAIAVPSVLLAGWLEQGIRWEQALLAAFFGCLIVLAVGFGGYQLATGVAAGERVETLLNREFETQMNMLTEVTAPDSESMAALSKSLRDAAGITGKYLFAILGIWFLNGFSIMATMAARSNRWGAPDGVKGYEPGRVKAPELLVYPFILCGLLSLLPIDALRGWCYNILIILIFIYFLIGLSILSFYVSGWRLHPALKILLYLLVLSQLVFCMVLAGVGLFDQWFDFRRLRMSDQDDS